MLRREVASGTLSGIPHGGWSVALVLLTAAAARAEPVASPQPTVSPCAASAAAANDRNTQFTEFSCWLQDGSYPRALDALERACSSSSDPACQFNRALVHHLWLDDPNEPQLEHCRVSRSNYAGYLASRPYDAAGDEVRQALTELNEICGPVAVSAPLAPAPVAPGVIASLEPGAIVSPPEPERPPPNPDIPGAADQPPSADTSVSAPTVLLGAGAVFGLAAGFSYLQAARARDKLAEQPALANTNQRLDTPRNRAWQRDQRDFKYMAVGLGLVGAAFIGTGIVLLVTEPAADGLSLDAGPGFAGLRYGAEF